MSKIKLLLDVVEDMRRLSDSIQTIADSIAGNTPDVEPIETVEPDSPPESTPSQITIEQVRAVLADASSAGKTEQVKELLRKHGSEKLSGIVPENYAALMEEVAML